MNSCLIATILLSTVVTSVPAQSPNRGFSVKDDIAMARFSDPSGEETNLHADDTKYSPDGIYVAIVTTKGLLASDEIESTISVFDLATVRRFLRETSSPAPNPRVVAVVTARPEEEQNIPYAPVIKDLRWSSDSGRLYFRGLNSLGVMQLDEVKVNGGIVRWLTPANYDVNQFDVVNDTIAFTAVRPGQPYPPPGARINRDALDVTGYQLIDILFPGRMTSYYSKELVMGTVRIGDDNHTVRLVSGYAASEIPFLMDFFPFRLSPDGQQLVSVIPVGNVPDDWKRYEPAPSFEDLRMDGNDPKLTNPNNALRPQEYALINLTTGQVVPLVKGPLARNLGYYGDTNTAAWAPDGSRILVTNVFLPLETKEGQINSAGTKPCAVASVELSSLRARCLLQDEESQTDGARIVTVRFGPSADEALVTTISGSAQYAVMSFQLREDTWEAGPSKPVTDAALIRDDGRSVRTADRTHVRVFIKQSLNDPPTLWASNPDTGATHRLWDPNPQLQRISFGQASVYQWKDRAGREWTSGLIMPVGYQPGKRYPLVIQMYQFRDQEFMTDGTDPSAFAARELASVGFVVLQIRKKPDVLSEADPQTHLEAYRSAIESLSDAGMIDPKRVGVAGFSWTCWYVINAIVKAPKLFAAATVADGLDNSYMEYLLFGPGPPSIHKQIDQIRGGSPFGPGLKRWVEQAPGFHLDQVQTPLRIESMKPESVLQEWEIYSSLYMQDKPVDFIYFPEGTHVHQRPLERLESQQGDVDWFRFWLQGYEDPDTTKRSQYERWHKMREKLVIEQAVAAPR
ncbi:MAG: hypothetical protein ABI380_04745 [Edaphobacter sp.]